MMMIPLKTNATTTCGGSSMLSLVLFVTISIGCLPNLTSAVFAQVCDLEHTITRVIKDPITGKFHYESDPPPLATETTSHDGNIAADLKPNNDDRRYLSETQLPMRLLQEQQQQRQEDLSNTDLDNDGNVFEVRKCICRYPPTHHIDSAENYRASGIESSCPVEADTCGIPIDVRDPVLCFRRDPKSTTARNVWPIVILWYFSLLIFLFASKKGRNAIQYIANKFSTLFVCYRHRQGDGNNDDDGDNNDNNNNDRATAAPRSLNERYVERLLEGLEERRNTDGEDENSDFDSYSWFHQMRDHFDFRVVAELYRQRENTSQGQEQHQHSQPVPSRQLQYAFKTKIYSHQQRQISLFGGYSNNNDNDDDDDDDACCCAICIMKFEDGDRIGNLNCQHMFHADCLKTWLPRQNACPLCKTKVAHQVQRKTMMTINRRTSRTSSPSATTTNDRDIELGADQPSSDANPNNNDTVNEVDEISNNMESQPEL